MEADLHIIVPTHYDLSGRNLHITYSTTGVDGKPHFSYQDLQQTRSFSGNEVRRVETEIGALVSVTFSGRSGGTTFSVLIPRVNMPAGRSTGNSADIWHHDSNRFNIPPLPTTGQRDFYTVTRLSGTASQIFFDFRLSRISTKGGHHGTANYSERAPHRGQYTTGITPGLIALTYKDGSASHEFKTDEITRKPGSVFSIGRLVKSVDIGGTNFGFFLPDVPADQAFDFTTTAIREEFSGPNSFHIVEPSGIVSRCMEP